MKKILDEFIKEELKKEKKLRENLENLIEEYVEFIEKNIPDEFMADFGVGPAGSHSQFGTHYGFLTDFGYSVPGPGFNIAGDFNAKVSGSNLNDMKEFAENIPNIFCDGLEIIKNSNKNVETTINKLNEINKYFNSNP